MLDFISASYILSFTPKYVKKLEFNTAVISALNECG
jgi:hypothetical protein